MQQIVNYLLGSDLDYDLSNYIHHALTSLARAIIPLAIDPGD